jgi:hypothetical protein
VKNGCDFLGHWGTKWEIKPILDGVETLRVRENLETILDRFRVYNLE